MQKTGILNPDLLHLLARIRHTNMLVIADRGFPFWPAIETVDLSLVDGIPTVLQVLHALRSDYDFTQAYMAQEFLLENNSETQAQFVAALEGIPVMYEAHVDMKKRVPDAIGLIRTGDITQFANVVLVSGRP
jgi:D-ribose pyranase